MPSQNRAEAGLLTLALFHGQGDGVSVNDDGTLVQQGLPPMLLMLKVRSSPAHGSPDARLYRIVYPEPPDPNASSVPAPPPME